MERRVPGSCAARASAAGVQAVMRRWQRDREHAEDEQDLLQREGGDCGSGLQGGQAGKVSLKEQHGSDP